MSPEQNAHVKTLSTRKEIFDHVVQHLRSQGRRSMAYNVSEKTEGSIYPTCAYRGDLNNMCAVGCLIADDEYSPIMEGDAVISLIKNFDLPTRLWDHATMLSDLQELHDKYSTWMVDDAGLSLRGEEDLLILRHKYQIS